MSETPKIPSDAIVSPDTLRGNRIPTYQVETRKWPILHAGGIPRFDPKKWDFTISPIPLVKETKRFSYDEFMALPRTRVYADMHCVTRWSKLSNLWEGVATREFRNHVEISPSVKFVMIHCDHGFTTNVPIDEFFDEDCLFAWIHNDENLTPDHGWPLRLVVPKLYAWKSAKWVRGIEFMTDDRPGFWESWENGGYHMHGDPWVVDPQNPTGERFRP